MSTVEIRRDETVHHCISLVNERLDVSLRNARLSLAGYNHLEVAQLLLENGSDPNATDKGGLIGRVRLCPLL